MKQELSAQPCKFLMDFRREILKKKILKGRFNSQKV